MSSPLGYLVGNMSQLTEQPQIQKRKRGRPRIEPPEPSKELQTMLDQLESYRVKAAELAPKIYARAREEGFSKQQARKMIGTRLMVSDRHVRRLLPPEMKETSKTTHRALRAHVVKATRLEERKAKTKEEIATEILATIRKIFEDNALGNLAKVRAIAKAIKNNPLP